MKLVQLTQAGKSWLGVDASGINLSLALDPLTLSISDGELELNRASGTGASKLDWKTLTPSSGITLPALGFDNNLDLHISGTATVTLSGVFTATGTGSLDEGQFTGTDSTTSQTLTGAQALALTLDTSVSAGGVGAAGASLKLVQLTQAGKSWLGVDASGINLSLALDPLTLSISDGELELNRASGTGASKLDWKTLTPTAGITLPALGFDNSLDLHISGTATVTLSGRLHRDRHRDRSTKASSRGPTRPTSQTLTGAQALALTLDTSVSAGGVGAAGASLKLVQLTQGGKSWLGVDASGITLSLALDPLTLSISDGELKLNRASGAGASKLDWKTLTPDAHGIALPTMGFDNNLDLHISGTATVTLSGVFTATGTGSLDVGQFTRTDSTTSQTAHGCAGARADARHLGERGRGRCRGRDPEARPADAGREELARRRRLRDHPLPGARSAHALDHQR